LGWSQLSRACGSAELELSILLRQRNLDVLEETFWAVSDPQNPRYGQHMALDEVNALVAPSDQHVSQVLQWLHSEGVDIVSPGQLTRTPNSDMLRVKLTVAQAEALLHTEYHEFTHKSRGADAIPLLRVFRYHVPTHLDDIIELVGPTVRFPAPSAVREGKGAQHWAKEAAQSLAKSPRPAGLAAAAPPEECKGFQTPPACLKALYGVGDYKASHNTSVLATGYLEQYIAPSDLTLFFKKYDPANERTATIVGPNVPSQPGTEASLDIQYVMGVAPGTDGTFWYTAGRMPGSPENEPFLVFLQDLSSTKNVPWVISTRSVRERRAAVSLRFSVPTLLP
jgi:tripeptidyl-peptidase-1